MSVHPSKRTFFDLNEIWYVRRGQRLMHDSMQYDPIQDQGQGHEPFLNAIPSSIYNGGWQVTTDS